MAQLQEKARLPGPERAQLQEKVTLRREMAQVQEMATLRRLVSVEEKGTVRWLVLVEVRATVWGLVLVELTATVEPRAAVWLRRLAASQTAVSLQQVERLAELLVWALSGLPLAAAGLLGWVWWGRWMECRKLFRRI